MRFHLSEDQIALKIAVSRFLADACGAGLRRSVVEGERAAAAEIWAGCAEIGVTGLVVPEEYGGMGLDLIDLAIVSEVFGYEAAPGPLLGHSLAALAISAFGSPAQKADWLPRLASGEIVGTLAIGEGDEDWSPDSWRLQTDGSAISGTKRFVPSAAEADLAVVGLTGGAFGIVDCRDGSVSAEDIRGVDLTRPLDTVTFAGCRIDTLPDTDAGRLFDALLTLLSADAYGAARRCIDMTVAYIGDRKQFGRAIGSFQAVKHQLANVTAGLVPTEALYWYAAVADGFDAPIRGAAAALAKSHIADRAMAAARTCVELHGGIGYTWDYDLHIWLKRAMFDFSYANVPSVHRARAVALRQSAPGAETSVAALL